MRLGLDLNRWMESNRPFNPERSLKARVQESLKARVINQWCIKV